ncbi:MAG: single-stranded DNA-binding protein [Bacteriovoracaceae bacterium]|jgi:hypothetical protein|nr:single-stranded DNA-binding protein [Bacteriovoracaceae bacterium]
MEPITNNELKSPTFALPEDSMESNVLSKPQTSIKKQSSRVDETFYGRLGKDPKLHYTNNKPVCTLNVAVNSYGKQVADWKRVIVWGSDAKAIMEKLKKGSQIFVKGHKKDRSFLGDDQEMRSITEIMAHLIGFPVA